MRELIYRKIAKNKDYTMTLWKKENEHIKSLTNMNAKIKIDGNDKINTSGDLACNAVTSYFHRVAPKVQLSVTNKIIGDLETTAQHILSTTDFVAKLANSKDEFTCPFQYDAGTDYYGNTTEILITCSLCMCLYTVFAFDELTAEADDDDDDDDDEPDENDEDDAKEDNKVKLDSLPEMKKGLEAANLLCENVTLANKSGARPLDDAFRKVQEAKRNNGVKNYPRNSRLCGIVDMRTVADDAKDDEKGADGLMFESVKDCAEVKTGTNTAMGYFHRSKTGIIPDANKPMNAMTSGPHFTV